MTSDAFPNPERSIEQLLEDLSMDEKRHSAARTAGWRSAGTVASLAGITVFFGLGAELLMML
ncbi:MAG: hypothetical protein IH942_02190, partial [Acidobacteria bacterium]|nr:hypothetical protein [Acidobacteriota bacterium]